MLRLVVIIVFCTLCIIPIAGFSSNIISNEILLIAVTFGLGYVALPAMLLHLWPEPKGPSMEAALAAGDLVTTQYAAVQVVEFEDCERANGYFLAEMSDGKPLCLVGGYLDCSVTRASFPSLEFRTFRNRTTGALYGIEPGVTPLQSWSVYGEFTDSATELVDGQLYDKKIARLVDELRGREARVAQRSGDGEQSVAAARDG